MLTKQQLQPCQQLGLVDKCSISSQDEWHANYILSNGKGWVTQLTKGGGNPLILLREGIGHCSYATSGNLIKCVCRTT